MELRRPADLRLAFPFPISLYYPSGMTAHEIINFLRENSSPRNVEGMARFGINPSNTLGVSIPVLRKIARTNGKDHQVALSLFASGIHEAKILAALIDDPKLVSEGQMEKWLKQFDSWDVTDQVCTILFDKTSLAWRKAKEWTRKEPEYQKRAAYSLMAGLAVHDRLATNDEFEELLPLILQGSTDERNYVKKAVNWALRGIGKRNAHLCTSALHVAKEITKLDSRSARWIASDAIRELSNPKTRKKISATEKRLANQKA
jgi:3-methyladenine DNA glycosylase AlkD